MADRDSPAPDPARLGRALPVGTQHYDVERHEVYRPSDGAHMGTAAIFRCYLITGEVVLRWHLEAAS